MGARLSADVLASRSSNRDERSSRSSEGRRGPHAFINGFKPVTSGLARTLDRDAALQALTMDEGDDSALPIFTAQPKFPKLEAALSGITLRLADPVPPHVPSRCS